MSKYDFMIVCHQRSGSHLLASFIDSHPQVCCLSETDDHNHTKSECVGWNKQGRIFMYHPFLMGKTDSDAPVAIHLVRNADKTAFSCVRNTALRKSMGSEYLAHVTISQPRQSVTKNFRARESYLKRKKTDLIANKHRVIEELISRDIPVLDIRYEHMTHGSLSVTEMPEYMAETLCHFLGVETRNLTTNLQKIAPDAEPKIDWSKV